MGFKGSGIGFLKHQTLNLSRAVGFVDPEARVQQLLEQARSGPRLWFGVLSVSSA